MVDQKRQYDRMMQRSAFQSLFWSVLLTRKRESNFTLKALADKLGINKSYITRSFSSPPNWQIDKISDVAEALGVDLIVEARDRATGVIYTPSGVRQPVITSSAGHQVRTESRAVTTSTQFPGKTVPLIATDAA